LLAACQALPPGRSLPMGSAADQAYARSLWRAMVAARMVGPHAIHHAPFVGAARPHGWILELAWGELEVAGHRGFAVVKMNYYGKDLTPARVARDRRRYLKAITVMYRRERGYDPDNQDWFWVKYRPDGRLFHQRMAGRTLAMAGHILAGPTPERTGGCLYCHRSAGGGDYIFYPEIPVPKWNGGTRPRSDREKTEPSGGRG